MSSKKGGGGRTYSNAAPSMRREGASSGGGGRGRSGRGGGSARGGRGGRGRSSGMQAQAEVHGEASSSKKRVRSSRAQNAFGYEAGDWDGESQQHQAQRYESEAAKSREYVLPENFEDEDLDSDEEGIFNSDDENKYGDVFAKSSAAKGKKAATAKGKGKRSTASTEDEEYEVEGDASEEDEDISGWEGAETINLSDMIGMDDASAAATAAADDDDEEEESRPSKKQKSQKLSTAIKLTRKQIAEMQAKMNEGEGEEDEDEELDEDEADEEAEADGSDEEMSFDGEEEDEDDDEAGGDAHKSLLSFVQGLKGGEDEESSGKDARAKRGRPQRGLQERNEAFEEGQFAIPKHTMGAQAAGAAAPALGGLKLSDLLKKMPAASGGDDKAGDNAALTALKKKLAVLSNSAHTKTLAEPLPEIRQDEMTRALSYAKAKEEVARWTPIINRNRDAATLSFPLNATPRINASSAELATRFKPSSENSLESDLAALMEGYGLKESSMLAAEGRELAAINVTPEEASKREEGVAKMKALLFYHEQKLRRMHKIKSKTYRRLKKKQREKGKLSLEEMKELEPLAYEAEQRKAEQRRIEERMSLSHSNSSKWMAKQLQVSRAQKGSNTDIREAITEHAKRAQELRNKQESFPKQLDSEGEELSEDSDDDDDEDEEEEEDDQEDGEDDEDDDGQTKASKRDASRAAELRAKLRELEASLGSLEDAEPAEGFAHAPGTTKGGHKGGAAAQEGGLVGLKFMQRAMEKKREETRAQIREFEAELEREEKREQMRRANRRAGLEEMDDEEIDVQIASSMPESAAAAGMDAASSAAAQRAGRKRVDVNTGAKGALVAAAAEDSVKLLPNSLQNASTGRSKASKTRVDGPIAVAMPAAVGGLAGKSKSAKAAAATAAAVAQALQGGNAHPGQHHLIHGKSSAAVDTPFISAEQSEQLFPLEKFSDDEDDAAAAAAGPNAQKVNLDKIKHDVRASIQQAKKKAIKGANKAASVRVGGIDDDEDDEDADADLEQAENGAAGSAAAAASESNPWAQTSVSNPRKAARMAAKAAKKAAFVKTGKVSFVADAGGDAEEGDSDDGAEGADAIDLDLSGGVSLRSKRSEFDLLSGGNMSQAELVRRAFSSQGLDADGNGNDDGDASGAAGPGVENEEQEFERLKREMMEEDLPKEETPVTGLPGWGAWGGLGASNFKSPAQLKKEAAEKARREARRAAANSSRADAKLKHVILNEKVDSKAMKYQVTTLPYPFTSLDQYERSLATPVGREWNTTSSFQQNVKPKVITKAGEIIEPAKFNPKVGQGAKEKAGKKNKAGGEAGQKRKR